MKFNAAKLLFFTLGLALCPLGWNTSSAQAAQQNKKASVDPMRLRCGSGAEALDVEISAKQSPSILSATIGEYSCEVISNQGDTASVVNSLTALCFSQLEPMHNYNYYLAIGAPNPAAAYYGGSPYGQNYSQGYASNQIYRNYTVFHIDLKNRTLQKSSQQIDEASQALVYHSESALKCRRWRLE